MSVGAILMWIPRRSWCGQCAEI